MICWKGWKKDCGFFFMEMSYKIGCGDGFPLEGALNLNRTLFNTSCETEICHIFLLRFDSTGGDKNESHIYVQVSTTQGCRSLPIFLGFLRR